MEVKEFSKQEFDKLVVPGYVSSKDEVTIYRYFDQNKNYIITKYSEGLSEEMVKEIYQYDFLSADYPILRPQKLIKIENQFKAFATADLKQYESIHSIFLLRKERYQVLRRIKEEILRFMQAGILFQNLDSDTILFDGKNILFSGILNSISIKNLGQHLTQDMIEKLYIDFNIFTISYLNKIPKRLVLKQIEEILVKWFNNQEYRHLMGVTDNIECLQYCCDLVFPPEQTWSKMLIDLMEKNKIKQKI